MYELTTTTEHMAVARVLCTREDENCAFDSSVSRAPAKESTATAGPVFSTMFSTVANCVINVKGGKSPELNN